MFITFYKMSGAGNDFIGIPNLDLRFNDQQKEKLTRLMCPRGTSVGSDGTLFIEPSDDTDFSMRYYNADGSEAETCGNGARCIARLAAMLNIAGEKMTFETRAGIYSGVIIDDEDVRVSMSNPTGEKTGITVDVPEFQGEVDFMNTGVPHVVASVSSLESYPVQKAGRALRFAEEFQPEGTNANFISLVQSLPAVLRVRTYERGVENETLACGTGCIASALVASRRFQLNSPVKCKTQGGFDLIIHFRKENGAYKDVQLQGPAIQIFRGEYHWKE